MEQKNSVEVDVIFNKLLNSDDDDFLSLEGLDIKGDMLAYIKKMAKNSECYACTDITSERKILGPIAKFSKRVMRKLIRWYIQPIYERQTEFNNAAYNLAKIQAADSKTIKQLEEKLDQLEEMQKSADEKIKTYEEKLKQAETIQQLINEKISNYEDITKDLKDLGILKTGELNLFDKKTYSQSGEDSIIAYIANALGIDFAQCSYLDIGANHAKDMSNTYFFYRSGAKGVLVEANPKLIPELSLYRSRDCILNKCIDTTSGKMVDFYILSGDGLSTSDYSKAEQFCKTNPNISIKEKVQVETITLNEVLEKYFKDQSPVILSIDIEGNDFRVLKSIDFKSYRPKIIIAEMIPYETSLVIGEKDRSIIEFMEQKGYREYAFTGINSIFVDNI